MILPVIVSFYLCQILGAVTAGVSAITGTIGDPKEHLWLVSIAYKEAHVCGGSIITPEIVLTTAQCTKYAINGLSVVAGGIRYQVIGSRSHDEYKDFSDTTSSINDVGLVRVSPRFNISKTVRIVHLITDEYEAIPPKTVVSVAGWISTAGVSKVLREASLSIEDIAKCKKVRNDTDTEGQICLGATNQTVCQGDAGGPVVLDGVQIGIVPSRFGCIHPHKPKFYINVAHHYEWIRENCLKFDTVALVLDTYVNVVYWPLVKLVRAFDPNHGRDYVGEHFRLKNS